MLILQRDGALCLPFVSGPGRRFALSRGRLEYATRAAHHAAHRTVHRTVQALSQAHRPLMGAERLDALLAQLALL